MPFSDCPYLGFGVGLRHHYFDRFADACPPGISWVEAISENFLAWDDGQPRAYADELVNIRRHVPIVLHGTSLSIGSADPVDYSYLRRLKDLIGLIEPPWVSDHLCWTGVGGITSHDLLPLPYTEEALAWVADKVTRVQDYLGRRILLENVSSYLEFKHSEMTEWDFLGQIAEKADCGILLDINNVYVSAANHAQDPEMYLRAIPPSRVGQIHLAGHSVVGAHRIDTHDAPVCDEVWELYRRAARRFGKVSTMIERDDKMPPWEELVAEVARAKKIWSVENGKNCSGRASTEISIGP